MQRQLAAGMTFNALLQRVPHNERERCMVSRSDRFKFLSLSGRKSYG